MVEDNSTHKFRRKFNEAVTAGEKLVDEQLDVDWRRSIWVKPLRLQYMSGNGVELIFLHPETGKETP